jgi:pimeloyl-ACP methyl ester carboxylesterase
MREKIVDSKLKIIANAGHISNMENAAVFNSQLVKFVELVNKKEFCLSDTDGN